MATVNKYFHLRQSALLILLLFSVSEASCNQSTDRTERVLSINPDSDQPVSILVEKADITYGLKLILKQQPENPEAAALLQDSHQTFDVRFHGDNEQTFFDPMAMTAVRDQGDAETQVLYVVLKSERAGHDTRYAVGEMLVHLDHRQDEAMTVVPGRLFNMPVHSEFHQVTLQVLTEKQRLYVSIKELDKYPGEPMTVIFDITPGSSILDPVDILIAPKK